MAKQSGTQKLIGSIDGLVYYKMQGVFYVRKKTTVNKQRLKTGATYQAFRQHQTEFGGCAKAAKLLRDTLTPVLETSIDNQLTPRLNKLMNSIKNLDTLSPGGKRHVSRGLKTDEGKALLRGFNFNQKSDFQALCRADYKIDRRNGNITFGRLDPQSLKAPRYATHAALHCAFVWIDFAKKKSIMLEDSILLPLKSATKRWQLRPGGKLPTKGLKFILLKIVFLSETNGRHNFVMDARFNAATVADLWE